MIRLPTRLHLAGCALAASVLAASVLAASVLAASVLAASALAAPALAAHGPDAGSAIFIADLNGRYGSTRYHERIAEAVAAIIALRPEAVVIAGDMIAGQASPPLSTSKVRAMWASFDRAVYQPLRRSGIPVLPVPGNHDASIFPAFAHERRAYGEYWSQRVPAGLVGDSRFPWYYAVELDAGRFIGLDVTAPGLLSEEQEAFLAGQRRAARPNGTPLLVATHLPLYPVAVGRKAEVFSAAVEPGAGEIWVAGHHHAYYAGLTSAGSLQVSLPPLGGNRRAWLGGKQRGPFGFVALGPEGVPVLYAWPALQPSSDPIGPLRLGPLQRFEPPPGERPAPVARAGGETRRPPARVPTQAAVPAPPAGQ